MKTNFVITRHIAEEAAVRKAAAILEEMGYEVKISTNATQVTLATDAMRHVVIKARQVGKTSAQDAIAKLAASVGQYTQYPPCETETK